MATGDGTVDASDSFNSTTVQLIPWPNHRKRPRQSFQFHNGTINTSYTNRNTLTSKVFQFHNGTINTLPEFIEFGSVAVSIPQRYN